MKSSGNATRKKVLDSKLLLKSQSGHELEYQNLNRVMDYQIRMFG